jgi:hypothetical protein
VKPIRLPVVFSASCLERQEITVSTKAGCPIIQTIVV